MEPLCNIAFTPTPLHRLDRLSEKLEREIWVKRDDLTGLALGGNKARKLAYLAADALHSGYDTLVTAGAAQSNHARMTAAAAATLGLKCHLVLAGPEDSTGNALLDRILGATIHWAPRSDWEVLWEMVKTVAAELSAGGLSPMAIPLGGATPIGCFGYVDAMAELAGQSAALGIAFDRVIFASGTGGTHAGLLAGRSLTGESAVELHAIAVAQPDNLPGIVASLATRTATACNSETTFLEDDVRVDARYWGGEYGSATPGGLEAIEVFATTEGLLLDPVYSGKAAHGLIDMCGSDEIRASERIVFLHTGGAPSLFSTASAQLFG